MMKRKDQSYSSLLLILILLTVIITPTKLMTYNCLALRKDATAIIDLYPIGNATLVSIFIPNQTTMFDYFMNKSKLITSLSNLTENVRGFRLDFVYSSRWRRQYCYFINGIVYNTGINTVPSNIAILKIYNRTKLTKKIQNFIISKIDDYFYLLLFRYRGSSFSNAYISESMFNVIKNKLFDLLNHTEPNYLIKLCNLEGTYERPYTNISVYIDLLNKKADIRISYLTGSSKLSYTLDPRDYINLRALPKNVSSLLNITLNIHIAYAYIAKIPKSYMISYANQSSLRYVLTVRINNRTDVDKLSPIWIAFESPPIIIYRTFNTTKFYNGTILKVRLVIINYGDFNIPNVTITEARWWDNKSVVFLSGDTKLTVNMLPKKTSRSLEYIVLINTTKKLDIKIPPAEAIVSTPVNTTFICESNENILHLNRHAPFINASISDLPLKPAISRTLKYTIIVSNLGDKKASNVVYGDIIIPSLKPDEKRIYIRKVNISHISPWYIKVNESVSYIFENKSYSISLQSVRVILYPDNPRVPLLKVILEPKIINKSLLNLSLELTNIGGEVIKQAILKGFYNKTVFEYVKGPFELSKAGIMQLKLTSIEPDHAIRYSCIFKVISNKSSFYPYLEIISLNKHMVLNEISQLRLFYNRSISFTVCGLKRICILNETYSLNVSIFFDKSLNPHRINISYISKSKNVKIVESKTWNRSKYILTYTLKFKILETGNITLPTIRLTLLSGGESIDLRYDLGNVTTYFGIKLNIDFPNSVIEGSKVIMKYRIYTDVPGGINNVTIKLQIPPELQIRENESYIFIKYDRVTRTAEGIITLKAKKPGTYRILINYACFTLNSVNIRIEGVDSRICNGVLMIEVKENVITRYWSYFIPALIITLLMIFISKKYG